MDAAGKSERRYGAFVRARRIALGSRVRSLLGRARWPSRDEFAAWWADQRDTEARARSAFFLVPVGLMIGIAMVDGAGYRMALLPALVLALPALALAWHLHGRGIAGAGALLLAFSLAGIALAAAELAWTKTTIFSGEATVRIEGRVLWRDRDDRDRLRYRVRIERTEKPVLSRPPETASILVSSRHEPIPIGGRFEALVRLRAPSGPAFPGAYDFAVAPWFEGRGANGFALGAPETVSPETIARTPGEHLVRLRLAISDRIRAVIGGGAGAVAAALITGERSGIPDDVNDWLRATGLSHVLSISGLHMALVAGFAMVLVRGLLAAIPGAVLVLPAKKIAAVAALAVATAYLVISGSNVATDRSYVMLSIMLVAVLVDRPALTLRNVALAAIVVLLGTPHAVVTASFQMSFAATTALIAVYGAASKWRASRPETSRKRRPVIAVLIFLAGLAASSAIAGTATAPYAAYHFQRVAPYGVIANLAALPIFSFWIMPLSLIAVLAMPFGLDAPFLVLIGWALDLVFAMAEALATSLPDAPSGRLAPAGLVVVTLALLIGCLSASSLRWIAVPIALVGLVLLPLDETAPELLIYEDGRELATIDAAGRISMIRPRPNDFVTEQWLRAYAAEAPPTTVGADRTRDTDARATGNPGGDGPAKSALDVSPAAVAEPVDADRVRQDLNDPGASAGPVPVTDIAFEGTASARRQGTTAFVCTPSPLPDEAPVPAKRGIPSRIDAATFAGAAADERKLDATTLATVPTPSASPARRPPRKLCRATSRNGLRIAWTDDHRLTGLVCDSADVAVVARAITTKTCRSGALLVTLRTLRRSGSLAISADPASGRAAVTPSITDPEAPWNRHRQAPWPEYWRNPAGTVPNSGDPATAPTSAPAMSEADPTNKTQSAPIIDMPAIVKGPR